MRRKVTVNGRIVRPEKKYIYLQWWPAASNIGRGVKIFSNRTQEKFFFFVAKKRKLSMIGGFYTFDIPRDAHATTVYLFYCIICHYERKGKTYTTHNKCGSKVKEKKPDVFFLYAKYVR
jgi:hypothetical protein